ncbi:hypothetical protein SPSIL_041180 [Sporomusa silvacetica DSM 10669]|uniref:Uncharacterized protein n=1 Tax=Sporomusa silvacetica DSM 10669 TaxID=1123289 RepID=A0ABZ3IQA8_9FIRM|nr:hypothetical protein [Sporomusa silvacetica]OZC23795.1 hypothetical protein SPSIL_00970 [Sporomusa silvacetica DSM 10669]
MLKLLRKKQLAQKIILGLCLGMTCAASAYAAETDIGNASDTKTATTSRAYGYTVDGTYTSITAQVLPE